MNVFVLNTKEDILKNEGNGAVLETSVFFPTMEVNDSPGYKLSLKYLPCVQNKHKYRFGNT